MDAASVQSYRNLFQEIEELEKKLDRIAELEQSFLDSLKEMRRQNAEGFQQILEALEPPLPASLILTLGQPVQQ